MSSHQFMQELFLKEAREQFQKLASGDKESDEKIAHDFLEYLQKIVFYERQITIGPHFRGYGQFYCSEEGCAIHMLKILQKEKMRELEIITKALETTHRVFS
jgi:hypothetical protein